MKTASCSNANFSRRSSRRVDIQRQRTGVLAHEHQHLTAAVWLALVADNAWGS
jgi:hypothetical protein